MDFNAPHYIQSGDIRLATYSAGNERAPAIILVHGWPEIAYSWKNQITPFTNAGYRVICYDLRGFGRSDCPHAVTAYGLPQLVADLEAVMDSYRVEDALICGHDWGGIIVWSASRMISHRVRGVISICTPCVAQAPVDPLKIFEKRFGKDHYFVDFNNHPGRAEALFSRDIDAFFKLMFRTTPAGQVMDKKFTYIPKSFERYLAEGTPPLRGYVMSDDDRAHYVRAYQRSGFHGGCNLYRNTTANWQLTQGLPQKLWRPSLMLSPADDILLPPETTDHMPAMSRDLTRHIIPDCGHWAMWDNPVDVNAAIIGWLSEKFPL